MKLAIILAGGLGKRMNSNLPKPAHKIGPFSMLQHVINKLNNINTDKIFIVFGQKGDLLKESVTNQDNLVWVHQEPQLGTGHAVQVAFREVLKYYNDKDLQILVCNGDAPFIKEETLNTLLGKESDGTLLTCQVSNPHGYGRIIVEDGSFREIVEEKDCDEEQRKIKVINAGTYCFKFGSLEEFIEKLENNNAQQEYYLTDVLGLLVKNNKKVGVVEIDDEVEIFNINSREQLEKACVYYEDLIAK